MPDIEEKLPATQSQPAAMVVTWEPQVIRLGLSKRGTRLIDIKLPKSRSLKGEQLIWSHTYYDILVPLAQNVWRQQIDPAVRSPGPFVITARLPVPKKGVEFDTLLATAEGHWSDYLREAMTVDPPPRRDACEIRHDNGTFWLRVAVTPEERLSSAGGNARNRNVNPADVPSSTHATSEVTSRTNADPAQYPTDDQIFEYFLSATSQLSPALKTVIDLRLQGHSSSEIAATLRVTKEAIRTRLARARKQVFQALTVRLGKQVRDRASFSDAATSSRTCYRCKGTRRCQRCRKETLIFTDCPECKGSHRCKECNGTVVVSQSLQNPPVSLLGSPGLSLQETNDIKSDIISNVTEDRPSPQSIAPLPKPSPKDPSAAFAQLIDDLATRDDSRRKSQAALVKPVLDAYLRTTPAPDIATKTKIAATINDALTRFELSLTHEGKHYYLKVEGEANTAGEWVLEPKGGKSKPLKQADAGKLPPLDVESAPTIGLHQMKENARRQGNTTSIKPNSQGKDSGPFAPLVPLVTSSKEELAQHLLEPLKERLRAMPHGTMDERKKMVTWLNQELREINLRVKCPATGKPASLIAAFTNDGEPRFVYYYRDINGKARRPFSTTDFDDLLDRLALIPASPRKPFRPR